MMLKHIEDLKLLDKSNESYIVNDIYLDSYKEKAIVLMIRSLSQNPTLKSKMHVQMALEYLGASMAMAFSAESIQIIEISLMIYKKWFGLSCAQGWKIVYPECIKEDPQFFYCQMIKQLSILFEKRTVPKNAVDCYLNKCKEILGIYSAIAVELNEELSEETWNVLLRVHLGIVDKFLHELKFPKEIYDRLSHNLIENLFNVCLLSGSQNTEFFNILSSLACGWSHRNAVIFSWFNVTLGLTRRMLYMVYQQEKYPQIPSLGKNLTLTKEGQETMEEFAKDFDHYVIVSPLDPSTNPVSKVYNIADEQVLYFWHRFQLMFRSTLPHTANMLYDDHLVYGSYIKCLTRLLKEYFGIGDIVKRKKKEVLFDVNDIFTASRLRIVPRFRQSKLFEPELPSKNTFIISTVASLLHDIRQSPIPVKPNGSIILEIFSLNFFDSIIPNNRLILEERQLILAELCSIFSGFPRPYPKRYVSWFYNSLHKFTTKEDEKQKITTKCIYNILKKSQLLFSNDLKGLHILLINFVNLAIRSLNTSSETPKNKQYALKIVSQIVSIPSNFIANEIASVKKKKTSPSLTFMNRLLELQKGITSLCDQILKSGKISGSIENQFLWVSALNTIQNKPLEDQFEYIKDMIHYIFHTKFDNDIFDSSKIISIFVVLDIIETFISSFTEKVDQTTSAHLSVIACKLLTIADEKMPIEGTSQYKKIISGRNCGYEKVLCSIIQLCLHISNVINDTDNEALTCSIKNVILKASTGSTEKAAKNFKDEYGQFAYRTQMMLNMKQILNLLTEKLGIEYEQSHSSSERPSIDVKPRELSTHSDKLISSKIIQDIATTTKGPSISDFISILSEGDISEEAYLKDIKPQFTEIEQQYKKNQVNKSDRTLARLFLKHFQLLSHDQKETQFHVLRESEMLLSEFRNLDSTSLRMSQIIPLLYYQSPSAPEFEVNNHSDTHFNEFLGSIGILLDDHHMKTGNFDHLEKILLNTSIIYAANSIYEQAFVVPSIRLDKHPYFYSLAKNAKIMVVYNARTADPYNKSIPFKLPPSQRQSRTIIVITPLKNGLFSLNVLEEINGEISYVEDHIAPIFNNSIINKCWLPLFLKSSCMIYEKYTNTKTHEYSNKPLDNYITQCMVRREHIKVMKNFKSDCEKDVELFFKLFSSHSF